MRPTVLIVAALLASAATSTADTVKVGEMQLCQSSVKSALIGSNRYTGQPVAIISLNDAEKAAFANLTSRSKGRQLPITLNGNVIANPWIDEAIYEGVFEINGPKRAVLERVVSAASSACFPSLADVSAPTF